ncbi:sugar phosphate isomerase/epimerase family protein [Bryobacter aggregatus]|uniref:sugar phosphate isomerase/epimerase family protein n=1 Tax=Bryobacter aggregatus TaxID=360054 RepID=UPI0004E20B8C|nr:sugar phosphate isomerase/epimerase family protein [Bryobacter aggregatus]
MKLGAVTYNVLKDWDVDTIIKNLEMARFEAVELRTGHKHGVEPTLTPEARKAVAAKFSASKIRLLSFGSTAEFQSPNEATRRENVENAKRFVDLAHDTGAWGVKVRPNGMPEGVPENTTIGRIADCLREVGDYGKGRGVEIWLEVHGPVTQNPPIAAAIMKATHHEMVGLCWNSNPTDVSNGNIEASFRLLRPWIKNVHINELAGPYPFRQLFRLLRESKYERYTLAEAAESKEPERFLRWYSALWSEMQRP